MDKKERKKERKKEKDLDGDEIKDRKMKRSKIIMSWKKERKKEKRTKIVMKEKHF